MPKDGRPKVPTTESDAFLHGLYHEFLDQAKRYQNLTAQLFQLEARVELAEKQLCLTRDHLAMAIERTEGAMPQDWTKMLEIVRFVGVRLAEACVVLLKERKKLTNEELLHALNLGMFRFRTNTPFREIHAALLRQRNVKRMDGGWVWTGPDPSKEQLRLRLVRPKALVGKADR